MIDYSEVGKRIRYYRIKEGLTQEQLAFDIETSASYLSNIERGVKKPSLQKVSQIAGNSRYNNRGLSISKPCSAGHNGCRTEPGRVQHPLYPGNDGYKSI